jgi:hypothetical protein
MSNITRQITGQDAVSSVLKALGLTAPVSVTASTDPSVVQMWELATDVGQQLCDQHDWQQLSAEFVITTAPGQTVYPLPADCDRIISDSSWNRTTQLPAIGSLDESEWQALKARNLAGATFASLFKIEGGALVLANAISTVQTLVIPYQSRAWVRSAQNVPRDNLQQNDDVILLDPQMFKLALRIAWMVSKEFDVSMYVGSLNRLIASAKAKDSPGRTISLAGAHSQYLGVINIPDTGYGN